EVSNSSDGGSHMLYAVLEVADTGAGIDEQTRPRLFEPFFTTKDPDQGTGLGLSIVRGIVKNHQGQLRVRSKLGTGSAFEVYLPLAATLPEQSVKPIDPRSERHDKATILLIEDSPEVRKMMRDLLADNGYQVLDAPHAEQAMRTAQSHPQPIDLLVTDVVLPGI